MQMIAMECNPFSTHVVVKAGQELITSIAEKRGVPLDWDHRLWIKDEYHREYKALANKPYNFFKHADRDSEATYDGPNSINLLKLNEVQTFLNVNGYKALGGNVGQAMSGYCLYLAIKYPRLFKKEWLDALPGVKDQMQTLNRDPDIFFQVLRTHFKREGLLPSD